MTIITLIQLPILQISAYVYFIYSCVKSINTKTFTVVDKY
ncbi:hypothetical protein Patl1_24511 [Pistacia atlantica]|uniref:Uncharacterized protein n=1 Tax=Pistacia atlantica TaxID=434234 RepID=A0ACC0ZZW4_9ROSI|nr:hypothetical protein Patl1_24511 [Pistacia atlantica]